MSTHRIRTRSSASGLPVPPQGQRHNLKNIISSILTLRTNLKMDADLKPTIIQVVQEQTSSPDEQQTLFKQLKKSLGPRSRIGKAKKEVFDALSELIQDPHLAASLSSTTDPPEDPLPPPPPGTVPASAPAPPQTYSPQKLTPDDDQPLQDLFVQLYPQDQTVFDAFNEQLNLLKENQPLSEDGISWFQDISLLIRLTPPTPQNQALCARLHATIDAYAIANHDIQETAISVLPTINTQDINSFMTQLKNAKRSGITIRPKVKSIKKWKNKSLSAEDLSQRPGFIQVELQEGSDTTDETTEHPTHQISFQRAQLIKRELLLQGYTQGQIDAMNDFEVRTNHLMMDAATQTLQVNRALHIEHGDPYKAIKDRLGRLFNRLNQNDHLKEAFKTAYEGTGVYLENTTNPGDTTLNPTKFLARMLFNMESNTYFMDGFFNILKGAQDPLDFLDTHEKYGHTFTNAISDQPVDSVRQLVDQTGVILKFKDGPPVTARFRGRGLGEVVHDFQYSHTTFDARLVREVTESNRKQDLYYFVRDILRDQRLSQEGRSEIIDAAIHAMGTGSRNRLRRTINRVLQNEQIHSPLQRPVMVESTERPVRSSSPNSEGSGSSGGSFKIKDLVAKRDEQEVELTQLRKEVMGFPRVLEANQLRHQEELKALRDQHQQELRLRDEQLQQQSETIRQQGEMIAKLEALVRQSIPPKS